MMVDMEHDWKAQRTEAARVSLVAQFDTDRRCAALESACRYEVEQHSKARDMLAHLEACRAAEVAARDRTIERREETIHSLATEIGALRYQLAAAMRTIESWTADRTPALTLGLRRCDATFRGVDVVVDYDVVPGINDRGEDCEAAETHGVWLGAVDISALLSTEAEEALTEQADQALDEWCADEAEELATAGVPSLREAAGVL